MTTPNDLRGAFAGRSCGVNTTEVVFEFGLLTAEAPEAFAAWRKGLPDLGEELADVFLYLTVLAEMNGVDLDSEVAPGCAPIVGRCDLAFSWPVSA